MKYVVNYTTSCHETGIDGSTDYTSKGVPCCWVKPVPEFLTRLMSEVLMKEVEHGTHIEAFGSENPRCATVRGR